MVKKEKKEAAHEANSQSSQDEEETTYKDKRTIYKEVHEKADKLRLDKFHRPISKNQNQKRKPTEKKQIRDIKRLIEYKQKSDKPDESKQLAKQVDLKELKRSQKSKNEASKFELRYKKIKFFEKKKVIRKLQNIKKAMESKLEEEKKQELLKQKELFQKFLTYINNFPLNWKYISLFPNQDTDKSKVQREEAMAKIQKMVEVKSKIREKELMEEDQESDDEHKQAKQNKKQNKDADKKGKSKQVNENAPAINKIDPFFISTDQQEEGENANKQWSSGQKKVVQRDGSYLNQGYSNEGGFQYRKPSYKLYSQEDNTYNSSMKPSQVQKSKDLKINPNTYRVKTDPHQDTNQQVNKHIKF